MRVISVLLISLLQLACNRAFLSGSETVIDQVKIDFQEGFVNRDSVVIMLNGAYLFSIDSLMTNTAGWAASKEFHLPPGTYAISAIVPKDSARGDTIFVHIARKQWMGINYVRSKHRIYFRIQNSHFGYANLLNETGNRELRLTAAITTLDYFISSISLHAAHVIGHEERGTNVIAANVSCNCPC